MRATVGGQQLVRHIRSGLSDGSHSDQTGHFGLGTAGQVDRLEIEWPSGERQAFQNVPAGRTVVITEGKAECQERPFRAP